MKNIWEIFRRDIKRIKNNVIAMIVIMESPLFPAFMPGLILQQAGIHIKIQET